MPDHAPIDLERLRYWQGQTLRRRDLQDQAATQAEVRWWHNRSLHDAFGVVCGLEVALHGENAVRVEPGMAFDCYGRELLLRAHRDVPLRPDPPAPHPGYTLLLRAARGGRLRLEWKSSRVVALEDGVPLVRLRRGGRIEPIRRREVRALSRPLVANGATVPGGTLWRPWLADDADFELGYETVVDASAAGFTELPCYLAWLEQRSGEATPTSRPDDEPTAEQIVLAPFRHVAARALDRFTFRLATPILWPEGRSAAFLQFAQQNLFVSWIGVQDRPSTSSDGRTGETSHGHP